MNKHHKPRIISPRLANGDSRLNIAHRLPEPVKSWLFREAEKENKSVGWMLEDAIIKYYELKQPKYKTTKKI